MNRSVVITGASRGLGLSLAKFFLRDSDKVYGVSRTRQHWKKAKEAVKNAERFQLAAIDLTKEAQVKKYFESLKKNCETLAILINNAGYGGKLQTVRQMDLSELDRHLEQNLHSAFLMCKYALPIFQKQKKGMIINISSMAGTRAVPKLFGYSAAKFGVLALSQAIAKENSEIQCVTICPGGMNTSMRAALFGKKDAEKQQGPDFVAGIVKQVADGKIKVESGGHIVIRHNQITGIYPAPGA